MVDADGTDVLFITCKLEGDQYLDFFNEFVATHSRIVRDPWMEDLILSSDFGFDNFLALCQT